MRDNENDDAIPINNEAPPVSFSQINNININNNLNNNINNININESNFNLFPNNASNPEQKNQNNQKNNNKNMRAQVPFICVNPFLLTNPIYQPYNMMTLNYINPMKNRNINTINNSFMQFNNIKNSINEKQKKNNSNFADFILNINPDLLKMLDQENLIDIILFIQDNCRIKIEPKKAQLHHHQVFKIEKKPGNDNEYLFSLKKNVEKTLLKNLNEQLEDNIYNEEYMNNINNVNNINNINYMNNMNNNNIYNNNLDNFSEINYINNFNK